MIILYTDTYEREGNDYWLIDKIQIIREDGELILRHKINHKGWNGPVKETREIGLGEIYHFNSYELIEKKQKRVEEYMDNICLIPGMKIPVLSELVNCTKKEI